MITKYSDTLIEVQCDECGEADFFETDYVILEEQMSANGWRTQKESGNITCFCKMCV